MFDPSVGVERCEVVLIGSREYFERRAIGAVTMTVRGEEEPGNTIHEALEAHLYAFAAEEARLSGETIDLGSYRERLVSPEK